MVLKIARLTFWTYFPSVSADLHLQVLCTGVNGGGDHTEAGKITHRNTCAESHTYHAMLITPSHYHQNHGDQWTVTKNNNFTRNLGCHNIFPMQISAFSKTKNTVRVGWGVAFNKNGNGPQTDLHSAFDQIEGHDSCVCGATAQNSTKATQDEILLRAELTTVSLWRNTGYTLNVSHLLPKNEKTFLEGIYGYLNDQPLAEINWFLALIANQRNIWSVNVN